MATDDQEFDLAALEEGQAPLEPKPLPLPGFPPQPPQADAETPRHGDPDAPEKPPEAGAPLRDQLPMDLPRTSPLSEPPSEPARAPLSEPAVAGEDAGATATASAPAEAPPRPATPAPGEAAEPPDLTGLTAAEAAERATCGQRNIVSSKERTNRDIARDNIVTFFNLVLGSLILILFALAIIEQDMDFVKDGLFVGIVVVANVAIGTFQEIRATNTLRKIVALSAPRARVIRDGGEIELPAEDVVQDDLLLLGPGDQVVADGPLLAESCEIDESLLTGESGSVRKGVGDALLSGSFCTAGRAYYRAEQVGPAAYAARLTADARQIVRRATPLQLRFRRLLRILLIATAVLGVLLLISAAVGDGDLADAIKDITATITSVVPEGLLLGMTVAFAVGAVRVSRAGAIVQDINAVEALNYVDVVCLDKTGTITANELTLRRVHWADTSAAGGSVTDAASRADRGWLGAFAVATAEESRTAAALAVTLADGSNGAVPGDGVPFNSERRWSALSLERDGVVRYFVLGAPETVQPHCDGIGELGATYEAATAGGLRGVLFAEAEILPDPEVGLPPLRAIALITLGDVLRPEVASAFQTMERLKIEPKIISGDNPGTVAALVQQLGVDLRGGVISGAELEAMDDEAYREAVATHSIFGRIAPEQKSRIVAALKEDGHFVAMIGDGANDVRALREADVAVAMESGASTARAVAGIILRRDSFAAFVRGTAIAQAVLGNSAQLTKLFITKSFYAYLIIIASNMLALDFPFLPRQGTLTALITLGIPTVFITLTRPPQTAGSDFTNSVLRFALPASLGLAAAAVAVQLLTEGVLGHPIEDSRTLISLTIGIVGVFFMIEVIGFDGVKRGEWRRPLLTTVFGGLLLGLLGLVLYTPVLRDFLDFSVSAPGFSEWVIVIPAVVLALGGQYVISRYWREIIDWILRAPGDGEATRGRGA